MTFLKLPISAAASHQWYRRNSSPVSSGQNSDKAGVRAAQAQERGGVP